MLMDRTSIILRLERLKRDLMYRGWDTLSLNHLDTLRTEVQDNIQTLLEEAKEEKRNKNDIGTSEVR